MLRSTNAALVTQHLTKMLSFPINYLIKTTSASQASKQCQPIGCLQLREKCFQSVIVSFSVLVFWVWLIPPEGEFIESLDLFKMKINERKSVKPKVAKKITVCASISPSILQVHTTVCKSPPRRVCQGEWLGAMIARKDGTRNHIASSETALREGFVSKSWAEAILWTWRKDSEGPVLLAL